MRKAIILWLAWVVLAGSTSVSSHQTSDKKPVLNSPADETTAVRFCDTDEEDYFHVPLLFRAIKHGDPQLNTAPLVIHEGRTAYISVEEMNDLMQRVSQSNLSWQERGETESFKWDLSKGPLTCADRSGGMEVLIVCANGSARGHIRKNNICHDLQSLDPALRTPRALWEFQLYRIGYGCKVPGFKFDTYPDHSH